MELILKKAALAGGEVLKKYFRKELAVKYKTSPYNIVTKADNEAQKAVIETIKAEMAALFPGEDFGLIAEEDLLHKPHETVFIIDPLDGTTNFASGLDYFAVTIALAKRKEILAGVTYDVTKDTLYSAQKGKGAYKIGDILLSTGGMIWDIAAGMLILSEAGGSTVDWRGSAFNLNYSDPSASYPLLASTNNLIQEILPHLKKIEA